MLGYGWLALRQAQDALKNGRLEEAAQLLTEPAAQGYKGSWELQQQVARAFVERGERYLRHDESTAAWSDLLSAERAGLHDGPALGLRQALTRRGLAEVRCLLEAGEPGRAAEAVEQLRGRSVQQTELDVLDEAARTWAAARDLGTRGEFAQALETAERARRLLGPGSRPLDQFCEELARHRQVFTTLLSQLHGALSREHWREVLQLSEQVLAMAPQHTEARKARARAWKAIEPVTVAEGPRPAEPGLLDAEPTARQPRFLLWVDGVGGFLVCLGNQVTLGQALPDGCVDVPLYADVSRTHARLTRDSEGYLLEALRPVQVNGRPAERVLLRSGDRITLGASCQLLFKQPAPVSASARLELASGHRLPLALDGVLLMADTLILGPPPQAHVALPELERPIVLYRNRGNLGVTYAGSFTIDGLRCKDRGVLGPRGTVAGEDFSFTIEPVGTRMGRT